MIQIKIHRNAFKVHPNITSPHPECTQFEMAVKEKCFKEGYFVISECGDSYGNNTILYIVDEEEEEAPKPKKSTRKKTVKS